MIIRTSITSIYTRAHTQTIFVIFILYTARTLSLKTRRVKKYIWIIPQSCIGVVIILIGYKSPLARRTRLVKYLYMNLLYNIKIFLILRPDTPKTHKNMKFKFNARVFYAVHCSFLGSLSPKQKYNIIL